MFGSRRDAGPVLMPDELPTEIVRPPPRPPTAAEWFGRGLSAAFAATTIVPMLNYVAFGTLAREAGFSLTELVVAAIGIGWVSGQVVLAHGFAHNMMLAPTALSVFLAGIPLLPMVLSVLPLLGARGRRWLALPLAQSISTVPWATAQQRLPALPEPARPIFFAGYAGAYVTLCAGAAAIAFEAAAGLPGPVRALLVFVLPLHLLFGAMGSARNPTAWLAIVLGVLLGPPLLPVFGDFTLMGVGLIGGTAAFLAVRLWRRTFKRVTP